jgi:Outer membrane efflux protein
MGFGSFERSLIRAGLTLALALSLGVLNSNARQGSRAKSQGRKAEAGQSKKPNEPATDVARLRAQYVQATKDYKSSLEQLLPFYEAGVKRADERLSKTKELYAQGLVARHDVERDEAEAASAREKVAAVRGQLKSADEQMAETLVEAEAEESAAKEAARAATRTRAGGSLTQTAAYIRYGGARAWSLSEAGAVERFFVGKFGRPLPVSSFGQSPVHDRWGYDHHNAMDVGLSPDSAEGRALMEYLRSSGVPFTAFRFAIPGTATGPHIHVGRPSHKVAPK